MTSFYSGLSAVSQWLSPYFSTQTGPETLLLVLQGKNIDTYTILPGYFLSFEAFVLFAQVPDEGN